MNKRFIRVAVFCALTATAAPVFVGCSDDYDADIANLQDQINKINGIIGVSSDDMTAAIDQVVEQMQAKIDELSATVDGKVNTEELTAQVEALNALIDQKADPSAIQAESEKLAGLIEEANKAAADANAADRPAAGLSTRPPAGLASARQMASYCRRAASSGTELRITPPPSRTTVVNASGSPFCRFSRTAAGIRASISRSMADGFLPASSSI